MPETRGLIAAKRSELLMSASIPDRRSVSLAAVYTAAPIGSRAATRARAASALSRTSTLKPCVASARAVRSICSPPTGLAKRGFGGPTCVERVGVVIGYNMRLTPASALGRITQPVPNLAYV